MLSESAGVARAERRGRPSPQEWPGRTVRFQAGGATGWPYPSREQGQDGRDTGQVLASRGRAGPAQAGGTGLWAREAIEREMLLEDS